MKVLLVKPNEPPVEAEIENTLEAAQKIVGGHIEIHAPNRDPVVYVLNEEGKVLGLEANRALYNERGDLLDIIAGTFFVCGVKEDEFISLSPELLEKYKVQFAEPEIFRSGYGRMRALTSISEQIEAGARQAAEYNADRPALARKDEKDRS